MLSFSLSRQSVNFPIYEFAFNHCNNYISFQEWRAEDKLRGLSRQNKYSSVHGWQMCLGISGKSGRFWHVCECCCSTSHKSQVLLFGGYVQVACRHRVAYQCQATSCFSPLCQLDFGQQFTNPYITHCLRASILKNVVSEESKFFFFKQSVLGSQKGKESGGGKKPFFRIRFLDLCTLLSWSLKQATSFQTAPATCICDN